eukprot:4245792-Pleurochrysis_carterae.AAC.2
MGAHKEDKTSNVRRPNKPEKIEMEERERWARNRKEVCHPNDKQHTFIHAKRHCMVMTSPGGRSTRNYERVTRGTTKDHQQTSRRELVEDGHNRRIGDGPSSNHRATGLEAKHGREISEWEGPDKTPSGFRATGEGKAISSYKPTGVSNSNTGGHKKACACKLGNACGLYGELNGMHKLQSGNMSVWESQKCERLLADACGPNDAGILQCERTSAGESKSTSRGRQRCECNPADASGLEGKRILHSEYTSAGESKLIGRGRQKRVRKPADACGLKSTCNPRCECTSVGESRSTGRGRQTRKRSREDAYGPKGTCSLH